MSFAVNAAIAKVDAPPIAEAMGWVRENSNRALVNLCQAVPSYPPAIEMQAEIARLAGDPTTSLYTDIAGHPALRAELAKHMEQDYRGAIEAAEVVITAGCNQAFCATIMAIAGRGDNVILPVPYYFNHQMWLEMLGIEARFISAIGDGAPGPIAADAEAVIDDRTRAIILCTPNNPTGAIYPGALIEAFYEVARAGGLALIIDETYKDFRSDPAPPHGLFSKPGWQSHFIQLYSFSKVFAITGYRVGSITTSRRIIGEIEKILDCLAICAPHISQAAALFGLNNLGDWKSEKRLMMAERGKALRSAFANPALTYRLTSAGAYFAYVRHPFAGETAKQVAQRLAGEHDLLCLPGSMFGPGQEDYLRLAFANVEAETMQAVAERLIESQTTLR